MFSPNRADSTDETGAIEMIYTTKLRGKSAAYYKIDPKELSYDKTDPKELFCGLTKGGLQGGTYVGHSVHPARGVLPPTHTHTPSGGST